MRNLLFCLLTLTGVIGASVSESARSAGDAPSRAEALYLGYYQEDPLDNPEDPTMGSLYLRLPSGDGDFAGNMYFTYVGCQTSNVGKIDGVKTAGHLKGVWDGTLDGTAQSGKFEGSAAVQSSMYRGTYTVAGGKQHMVVGSCIEYYIASKGTFELFPLGNSDPGNFIITFGDHAVSWKAPAGALLTLVSVLDTALALEGEHNATLWQTLVMGTQSQIDVSHIGLIKGRKYVASVSISDPTFKRISFGSTSFVAP